MCFSHFSAMIIDMHVHTSRGSGDSELSPQQLVDEAHRIGLQGACFTEHSGPWDHSEFRRFSGEHQDLLLVPAMEVETDMGHITVFGLDAYVPGIRNPKELRRVADEVGAYLVLAHPFRNLFHKPPYNNNLLFRDANHQPKTVNEAVGHPVFELIDAIEVANGANIDEENIFAWEVAKSLKKPMVGGSDAHSINGLGKCVTAFLEPITSPEEFLAALHGGEFYPATGLHIGNIQPFPSHAG